MAPAGGGAVSSGPTTSIDILGIGMSMIDSIQVIEEFPAATGVTESSTATLTGGGPVPTALCAAAKLGARTAILDQIGDDWCADLIAGEYRKYGVSVDHLHRQKGRTSSFGSVLVRRRDAERHIVFTRGSFDELNLDHLPHAVLEDCKVLHLNGRHWDCACESARIVKNAGGKVSFDGGANRFDERFLPLLAEVDILIVASDFAKKLAGSNDLNRQLDALGQWDAEIVGITDGEKGSWFRTTDGTSFHQPAFAVTSIVDTTGCGDVFHGAFLYALCQNKSWEECAAIASAAAACSAKALGGRGALPGMKEVMQLVRA